MIAANARSCSSAGWLPPCSMLGAPFTSPHPNPLPEGEGAGVGAGTIARTSRRAIKQASREAGGDDRLPTGLPFCWPAPLLVERGAEFRGVRRSLLRRGVPLPAPV